MTGSRIDYPPPALLMSELEQLKKQWGPLALHWATNDHRMRGRPQEWSQEVFLSVWHMIKWRAISHDESVVEACQYASKHWVISRVNSFVGVLSADQARLTSLRYRQATWRRLYNRTARYLRSHPEELAQQERLLAAVTNADRK